MSALLRPSLRRVINATGVVLHTNLGRAPLAPRAVARVAGGRARATRISSIDLSSGERGVAARARRASCWRELTGAEAALVVNNNAAGGAARAGGAGRGREAVVSRGELVEIGGGFRVPDVMRAAGARLVEVGTTNRTHARRLRGARSARRPALLLKVHRSNFALVGFTEEVGVAELADAGARARRPDDDRSRLRRRWSICAPLGFRRRADACAALVRDGADLVHVLAATSCWAGRRPGIILGRRALVEQCARIR